MSRGLTAGPVIISTARRRADARIIEAVEAVITERLSGRRGAPMIGTHYRGMAIRVPASTLAVILGWRRPRRWYDRPARHGRAEPHDVAGRRGSTPAMADAGALELLRPTPTDSAHRYGEEPITSQLPHP